MTHRAYNFSAGPAVLPEPVLRIAKDQLLELPDVGASVMEISHRSAAFKDILDGTRGALRELLELPDEYHILFLQGGSRLQFAMVPMNLRAAADQPADYVLTGSWGQKAIDEARLQGAARVAWDGSGDGYRRIPTPAQLDLDPGAAYVHFTSNETIEGVQFAREPDPGSAPLVCDASSDFLSRPIDTTRYGLIYACAQKNAGPAGVTIVLIRDDLVQRSPRTVPRMLSYQVHADHESLFNTPPTFAIYMVGLVARWLLDDVGGLAVMDQRNRSKAKILYDAIDQSEGFFRGHADPSCRSLMNVTFRLSTPELEKAFVQQAAEQGMVALAGHRSVGGIRASIYNAMPVEGVETLGQFMRDFCRRHA